MKKTLKLLIPIISALLISCAGQGFSVSSVSLVQNEDVLQFSFIPDREDSYELVLRSPDGSLEWTSPMTSSDPYMISDELAITAGASFPQGSYSWFIIASDGSEMTGTVSI